MADENNEDRRRERIRKVVQNRNSSHSASRFDTSDIIQETELQLWQNGHDTLSDDLTDVDQALLASIAKGHLNKSIRNHRAQKRDASKDQPINQEVVSNQREPHEEVSYQEQANRLLSAINQLDTVERDILFLHYFCGDSFVEIGQQLDLTKQRLQTRFAKAKHRLRFLLSNE